MIIVTLTIIIFGLITKIVKFFGLIGFDKELIYVFDGFVGNKMRFHLSYNGFMLIFIPSINLQKSY